MRPSKSLRASLSHLDSRGKARMVDVTRKPITHRVAVARGEVHMSTQTIRLIQENHLAKGDALAVARIAGIQAAKKTSELIPLCHPLSLTDLDLSFQFRTPQLRNFSAGAIMVESRISCTGPTGVEMEALTAVAIACLTLYDMVKSTDRSATITNICLVEKRGGKSGTFRRKT